jgi:hypothetical protein
MSKRTKNSTKELPKISKDKYYTWDKRPGIALRNFIRENICYYEPCVGAGDLVETLRPLNCVGYSDEEIDARTHKYETQADFFITNPPWTRSLLHPIIENLRLQLPTWLLFDADWMYTTQSAPYMKYCKTIISVGRLKWIPGTTMDGYDNIAWYLFIDKPTSTSFISR